MASFKVPCPSCENQVLITDPGLIGTKVECPKCKYRFKAEEPAGGLPKDEAKGEKAKGKEKKKAVVASGDGKKKSKKLVAMVVGGLAVIILAVVGFAMLGGDKKPKSTPGGGGGGNLSQTNNLNNTGTDDGTDAKDKEKEKDKGKEKEKVEPIEAGRKVYAATDKDENATTNLLPAQTVALHRFDFAKLRQTPLALLFDPVTADMFQSSFGLRLTDVATYYHAFVGDAREPFGVMRLRIPVAAPEVVPQEAVDGAPKEIRKRKLFLVKNNPFINGASNAFSFSALFGDYFDFPAAAATLAAARAPEKKPMGICVYDSQHVLIGDYRLLQSFLGELDDKGLPKFSPVPAEKPMYRSIDYQLKKALIEVGSETGYPAAVIYAEKLVPGLFDLKNLKSEYQSVSTAMSPVLSRTRFIAASLNAFNPKQLNATIRFIMDSESSAADVVKEHLALALPNAALAMTVFLNSPVEFRNLTLGDAPTTTGGTAPPGPGSASGYSERYGQQQQRPPGVPTPPPAPPPPSTSGGPKGAPSMSGPPGPGMMRPGMMQRPPGEDPLGAPTHDPNLIAQSHLDLAMSDQVVSITFDLNWDDDTYRRIIAPRLIGMTSSAKGKMAVFASELSYHALSAAVPKMLAATKEFPRGTVDRKMTDANRMGLRYKPESCVSFFVELLPYIGPARASLTASLDRDLAWFDEKNLHVAEGWVPELLVPHYPQTAWRANWPDTPGRVFGGTNYVAIAGVGLNAARLNPKKDAKKVGITGYEWGSKVDEVTDGLPYTIYLMQTPPGLHQPWLAGGGATIRGLDEKDPMQGFRHKHGTPGGKEGTFALMGDGSVRFIPGDIKADLLLAMATRAGGETFVKDRIDKEVPLVYSPDKKKETELKASRPAGDAKTGDGATTSRIGTAPEPKEKR
jgi:hypothetical protein